MAVSRTNLSDSIVTARKFVQIGRDAEATKNRLRSLSSAISSESLASQIKAVRDISADSKVTPEEKVGLSKEWNRIQLSYANTRESAEELNILDSESFKAMESAYSSLEDIMTNILGNMDSSSSVDMNFTISFDTYIAASSAFTSYMISVKEGIEDSLAAYRCYVDISPADITLNDTVTLTARIMNGSVDVTSLIINNDKIGPDKAFNWEFTGTTNDEKYNTESKGKQIVQLSASEVFASSKFNVRFYTDFDVSLL